MRSFLMVSFLIAIFCLGCTSPDRAEQALLDEGYTDIQITGYAWLECSDEDTFKNTFVAKNVNGKDVEGAVCCGLIKGCTVRH